MPMFLAGLEPNHISRTDLFDRSSFVLHPAEAEGDNQRLAERMRVPGGAGAGLEGDGCAGYSRRRGHRDEWIDPYCAGEPVRGSFVRRLRSAALNLHGRLYD